MFHMNFKFENRNPEDLHHVNSALAGMALSGLRISDSDGYLAVRTEFGPDNQQRGKSYHYGYDSLELECECDKGVDLHHYQIDVQAFPKGEFADSDSYHRLWCADHPDRVMRLMQVIAFESSGAEAYVVLHHAKPSGPSGY